VHRDIKPTNILITEQGDCLLTDFGIAKIVEGTSTFTQMGGTLGTPTYMSPEQIRGEKLDGRSDVYSLGVVLYEMATGRLSCRPNGDCADARVSIYRCTDSDPARWDPGPGPENNPRRIWP
jgi:serine/threonine protein kinase